VVSLGQVTPERWFVVPEDCAVQMPPPSTVPRIVPEMPTATQVVMLGQMTPERLFVVPEDRAVQVPPPLVVLRIVPP
jgi:hypothetical protein